MICLIVTGERLLWIRRMKKRTDTHFGPPSTVAMQEIAESSGAHPPASIHSAGSFWNSVNSFWATRGQRIRLSQFAFFNRSSRVCHT